MNLPSVKTLMRIGPLENDKESAKLLRKVLETSRRSERDTICASDRKRFSFTLQVMSHGDPTPVEMKLLMANDLLDGCGIEHCGEVDMFCGPPLEYVNLGDTYDVTLCRFKGRFVVSSWGDIVEKNERLFRDQ